MGLELELGLEMGHGHGPWPQSHACIKPIERWRLVSFYFHCPIVLGKMHRCMHERAGSINDLRMLIFDRLKDGRTDCSLPLDVDDSLPRAQDGRSIHTTPSSLRFTLRLNVQDDTLAAYAELIAPPRKPFISI